MNHWRITYASPKVSVPVTQSVGTTHAPAVRDATRVHRWRVVVPLVLALTLISCNDQRGSNPGANPISAGETLASIGYWFTLAGSLALGVGILGRVACLVMPALAGFAELLGDIAVIGIASLLLGTSFIWLGNHTWLLAIVIGLLLIGIGVRYRVRIARFLGFPRKSVTPKVANV